MPMASALTSAAFSIISAMRDLDAEVVHLVAVVGEDDVDEVLADVVDVALHRGEHDAALAAGVGLLHVRLEVGDGGLHRLGRLQHERQLHLAGAEQLADDLHAGEQHVVDDGERRDAVGHAPRRGRRSRPSRSPSMMRWLSSCSTGQSVRSSRTTSERVDVGEDVEQLGERVVAVAAAVVDEVEGDLALLVGDPVQRHDARRVHDGGVEAGLDALVQEHRVEHVAGRGLEAEGDVGDAERRVDAGQLGLDAADGLDGARCRRGGGRRRRWRAGR